MANEFTYADYPHPHLERGKTILKLHPEVKQLIGPYPLSAVYISLIVAAQIIAAIILVQSAAAWWVVLLTSYFFGAFCNHALFVMIHECGHNLVFRKSWANKMMGIICNLPLAIPSAISFRYYHMLHHHYLGNDDYDADIPTQFECRWVGDSWWRKTIWLAMFGFAQGVLRPAKLIKVKKWDQWVVLNWIVELSFMGLSFYFLGYTALIYFFLSTFFGLGLHPLGGRWIQEHFVFKKGQETYSYYGPLNWLTFNMGYHNEHHDLMMVSWAKMKNLNQMAPEFYRPLYAHSSWLKVIWCFITDKNLGPQSRILHVKNATVRNQDGDMIEQRGIVHGEHVYQTESQTMSTQQYSSYPQ